MRYLKLDVAVAGIYSGPILHQLRRRLLNPHGLDGAVVLQSLISQVDPSHVLVVRLNAIRTFRAHLSSC
jgi:hypothetical protein